MFAVLNNIPQIHAPNPMEFAVLQLRAEEPGAPKKLTSTMSRWPESHDVARSLVQEFTDNVSTPKAPGAPKVPGTPEKPRYPSPRHQQPCEAARKLDL